MDALQQGDGAAPAMLSQILVKQGEMSVQLAVISEQLKAVHDHENRIRALERWRYSLPLTALLAIGSTAVAIVSFFTR